MVVWNEIKTLPPIYPNLKIKTDEWDTRSHSPTGHTLPTVLPTGQQFVFRWTENMIWDHLLRLWYNVVRLRGHWGQIERQIRPWACSSVWFLCTDPHIVTLHRRVLQPEHSNHAKGKKHSLSEMLLLWISKYWCANCKPVWTWTFMQRSGINMQATRNAVGARGKKTLISSKSGQKVQIRLVWY